MEGHTNGIEEEGAEIFEGKDVERWTSAKEAALRIGQRSLAASIEKLSGESVSLSEEMAVLKKDIKNIDVALKRMQANRVALGVMREFAEKTEIVSKSLESADYTKAGLVLSQMTNLVSTELPPALESSRHLRKMAAKIESLRSGVKEGLEEAAEEIRFMAQNDADDVSQASNSSQKPPDSLVFYTLRIPKKPKDEVFKLFKAAKYMSVSTLHRCLKRVASRINQELFRPLISAATSTPPFRRKQREGDLPPLPESPFTSYQRALVAKSEGKSKRAKTWRIIDSRKDGVILAIFEEMKVGAWDETEKSCSEEVWRLLKDLADSAGLVGNLVCGEDSEFLESLGLCLSESYVPLLIKDVLITAIPVDLKDVPKFEEDAQYALVQFEKSLENVGLYQLNGPTPREAAGKRLRAAITDWLSGIKIGGREKRRYDSTEIVNFGIQQNLEDIAPEELYKHFVEYKHKQGTDSAHRSRDPFEISLAQPPSFPSTIKDFLANISTLHQMLCRRACLTQARNIIINPTLQPVTGHEKPFEFIKGKFGQGFKAKSSHIVSNGLVPSMDASRLVQIAYGVAHQNSFMKRPKEIKSASYRKMKTSSQNSYLDTARDIFQLYIALVFPTYAAKFEESPQAAPILRNDCIFIARHLANLQLKYRNEGSEGSRFADLIRPCEVIGARAIKVQLATTGRQVASGLSPIVGSSLTDLQLAWRQEACEQGINIALKAIIVLREAWRDIVPMESSLCVIGSLVHAVCEALVASTLNARDISQLCAQSIRDLLSVAERVATSQPELSKHVPSLSRVRALMRILADEQRLSSVAREIAGGLYQSLSRQELANVIKATWGKSDKREALLMSLVGPQ
eukprot:CAMPEP_0167746506 /NCGR_PEP_ID=MMETSP0110_2-20121227/3749_1 /TAXON_ID=629695 /ORGANISM="Gymnochlora sp., Strain CCMP2014" /LENGTH=854 /DNA_ID=CAMNT_0007631275 /DNA_START=3 /DNA_END=2564 /DNA_ORIENTATION=+